MKTPVASSSSFSLPTSGYLFRINFPMLEKFAHEISSMQNNNLCLCGHFGCDSSLIFILQMIQKERRHHWQSEWEGAMCSDLLSCSALLNGVLKYEHAVFFIVMITKRSLYVWLFGRCVCGTLPLASQIKCINIPTSYIISLKKNEENQIQIWFSTSRYMLIHVNSVSACVRERSALHHT